MNKTKKVAWHKHLKREHRLKERAQLARAQARGAAPASPTRSSSAAPSRQAGAARQTTPRQP